MKIICENIDEKNDEFYESSTSSFPRLPRTFNAENDPNELRNIGIKMENHFYLFTEEFEGSRVNVRTRGGK